MSLTWDQAIQKILRENGRAMHYTDIADEIIRQGLRDSVGATPASTVNAIMNNHYPEPYVRIGEGLYALKEWPDPAGPAIIEPESQESIDHETGAINAFGMFWRRDWINWECPELIGRQEGADLNVNFNEQVGVYLLHDRDRVIYVGRAGDALIKRLKAHTSGRFGGRWDRFSWFGLKPVTENGTLSDPEERWEQLDVIETMEAILIECLEPSQNRKRGDNLGDSEFVQVLASDFRRAEARRLLDRLLAGSL